MKPEKLAHMANQIAAYFAAYGHEEAVRGTADHIAKFWDPRMRAELQSLAAAGGAGLSDICREAARALGPPPLR